MRGQFAVFILLLSLPALAAQELNLKISTDKTVYAPYETVRVSGSLLDNMTPVPSAAIAASLLSESGSTTYSANSTSTSANGTYFTYLLSPSSPGNYKISVAATSASSVTGYIGLRVAQSANFNIELSKAVYSPGDNVSVSVYVKDTLGSAIPNVSVNATLINSTGGLQSAFPLQYSDSGGKAVFGFSAPSSAGYYTFLVNGLFGQSLRVASFQVYAYVTNSKGDAAWSFSPGDKVTINAIVTDTSWNPYTASISAVVTSPPPTVTAALSNFTQVANSTGKYRAVYSAGAQEGTYSVKVSATSGTASADTYTNFQVSNLYVVVEKIEGLGGSATPNASFKLLATVRDSTGSLKSNATVAAKFANSVGEAVSSFSGTEDTASRIYTMLAYAPTDTGTFDFTVTAVVEGKTASWATRIQVYSIKAVLSTDKFTYTPGDTVSVRVETQPATAVANLSYEVWGPSGIESSGSNFTQGSGGTASFSLTAPRSNGFYSLNVKVNGIAGAQVGFEVRKYRTWIDTRNGSSSDSTWQQVFPAGSRVFLHVNFQDPAGQYINITSSAANFSYSASKLYSHSGNREYSANLSLMAVYEGQSSTVAVLSFNSSSLPVGDYGLEIAVKDKNGNKESAYGGFRIGAFNVFAFPNKWHYSSGDDVNITVSVREFNGSAIPGAAVSLVSSEQADRWPSVADSLSAASLTNATTNAGGQATLVLKSMWASGFHQLRLLAEKSGVRQEVFAGFLVQGFSLSGTIAEGQSLYPGQNYTVTATAQDSGGTPVSSVNVTLIEVRSALNWNLLDSPSDNFGLTDSGGAKSKTRAVAANRQQGSYVLVLKGEKNGEVVYANVWYEIKSFDVRFQSGKSGQYEEWFWAGVQQPGSSIDMPTKVTKGGSALSGANLSVARLVRTDVWPNTEVSAASNSTSTSSGGTATVRYPIPSSLPTGEYAIILNVSYLGYSSLTDPWRSPHVLVRTYEVFMDLQKGGMFVWGTMPDENVSVVFNVRYPQNFTGVSGVNVSLIEMRSQDEILFRNLSVQVGQNYQYPVNQTDNFGVASIPLATPNRTGTFILVGRAGGEEFRRWFDVTSFTPSIDMNNSYEFLLNANVSFVAHAKDSAGMDVSGVLVNVSGVWNNWDWAPLSNFVPQVVATGPNGAAFKFIPASAGITGPGDYSARVAFTSGTSVSEFWMWFRVKSFDVRVYPTSPFSFGVPANFTVEVSPAQAGISAKILRLRSAYNWNVIADYAGPEFSSNFSGTTAADGKATVLGPSLERGEYVAEFNVTGAPPFFTWFSIRSFEVNAWLDQWAYRAGQNLTLRVCIQPPSNATVNYTAYGSAGQSAGNFSIIEGDASCSNGRQLSGLASAGGSYKLKLLILNPANPSQYEERWLWYEARTYDAWAWFEKWQLNPGENVSAHANVRLGNTGVQGINVTLESIGFDHDYPANQSYSELGLSVALIDMGWNPQSYAIVNLTEDASGASIIVQLNQTPEPYAFRGNYSLQLFGAFTDRDNRSSAKVRVDRNVRDPAGIKYYGVTDQNGETVLMFPVPSNAKSGGHSARFNAGGQDITPWFDVIPFSYRAYLMQDGIPKKSLDGGKPASIIVNSSSVLNVSLIGIMRNGWEPVTGIAPGNDSQLNIGGTLRLGLDSVKLGNITCPPKSQENMFEPCRANMTVNASGQVSSSEVWPWQMLNFGGLVVNVRNIFPDAAEVSMVLPLRNSTNATRLVNFSFDVPNQQGGYSVSLLIQQGETSAYDMLWFNIDSVNAWGWTERWQYNVGENIVLVAQVQQGPIPAPGYVANVTRLRYCPEFSPPDSCTLTNTSYNATTGPDGMARITIPPQSGGEYEATVEVFHPSNPSTKVTFSQWFRVRSFDVWMYTAGDWAVYFGDNISFVVETSPQQPNAFVSLFEDQFNLTPEASIELRQPEGYYSMNFMMLLGETTAMEGVNITFFNTSRVCEKGPQMEFGDSKFALLNVSTDIFRNLTVVFERNKQTGDAVPVNVSASGGVYQLIINDVHCRPVNESFFPLANGTADSSGRITLTFNTTRLRDNVSSEHPLFVNVTNTANQTSRGFGGFMLKPFDVELWFEGKGMDPSFLPTEQITVKVRVSNRGTNLPGVSIIEEGFSTCPESSGPTGGGGSVPGGQMDNWCRFNQTNRFRNVTDAFGMASFVFDSVSQSGNYDIGVKAVDSAGKVGFQKINFRIVSFAISASPTVTEPGTPVVVSITSSKPNASSGVFVEDKSFWNSTSNSFNFRSYGWGTLNPAGSGTLVINTTGMMPGYYNMRVDLTSNGTTSSASSSFEVRAYALDIAFDKGAYLPGGNMTVTFRATRGGYPLPGVNISRIDMYDELNWATPSVFYDINPAWVTGPDGILVRQIPAPSVPSMWSLSVRSQEGMGPYTYSWADFLVSSYSLVVNPTPRLIPLNTNVTFSVNLSNGTAIPAGANLSFVLVNRYNPVSKTLRTEGNLSDPSQCKITRPANSTALFSCNLTQPGLYEGKVVLHMGGPIADFSNVQGSLAAMGSPGIMAWAIKNPSSIVSYPPTPVNGSSPRVNASFWINYTSNPPAVVPFTIYSPVPFPYSFYNMLHGAVMESPLHILANLTPLSIPAQAPDFGGAVYPLTVFTNVDLSLAELVGGSGITGDLRQLVDIRENALTINQAPPSILITSPASGSNVSRDFPVTAIKGGNLTADRGMRVRVDGVKETPFMGAEFWYNMTVGPHFLEAWLVNETGGQLPYPEAYHNVNFTVVGP